jgi:Flp pilus assembly protein TadD
MRILSTASGNGVGESRHTDRRRLPWWKKLAFSVVTTLLFFAMLEGGLALLGVEPAMDLSDPFVGFAGSSPVFVPDTISGNAPRMVTAPNKLAWFNQQSFPRHKAAKTRRVFCLGGSTTYGRPYDDSTSFAGWLRELLPRVAPETRWEVINAGGVSYASYRVARLATELVKYEPDLFIVYTGHNEFLEDRTYADLKQTPAIRQGVMAAVSRTRTGELARRLLVGQRNPNADGRFQLSDDVNTVLDHTVGPTTYKRDVEQRQRILEHFEINLRRIVATVRSAGAEVVLVTPASNLKDCSPFKSQHSDEMSEQAVQSWAQLFEQARQLDRSGKFEDALLAYRRAENLDPLFAELHWRTGRVLLKLERFEEARVAFARAIDEDVCPLRAVTEITRIIHRTADRLNVPLVDFEQLMARQSRQEQGHGSPGDEYFLDHVHPTISTNGQLAAAIVEQLIETDMIQARSAPTERMLAEVSQRIESRIDTRQHAIALRNLAKVLNWAGKHVEAGSLAMRAVEQLPDDPESLVMSAAYLAETGRMDQAIEHYRRALRHRADYATAHQMLGAALVDRGELTEALKHFTELSRLRPDDALAWQMIGAIYAEQRQFDESLPYYETALALKPDNSDIHYNLANALGHLGRTEESIKHYMHAIRLNPTDTDARNNLGVLLMRAGRRTEAAVRFREVLRIQPEDPIAAANLRDVTGSNRK